ncbi:uncharacterized protein EI90DRAFT_3062237, partial [Cantharellus anzutake]|uniref:uncharacterized protein n=1 Tax=Cantharellus anzutake TaxID=1750568 RepID=UPI0019084F3C
MHGISVRCRRNGAVMEGRLITVRASLIIPPPELSSTMIVMESQRTSSDTVWMNRPASVACNGLRYGSPTSSPSRFRLVLSSMS